MPVQVFVVHAFASSQFVAAFAAVHVNVQSLRQPSLLFAFAPSSHASAPVRTLSPQRGATHAPVTQMLVPPQVVPLPTVGFEQRLAAPVPVQVFVVHAFASSQFTFAFAPVQVNVQLERQPSLLLALPSSHCSPGLTMPLPHVALATQAPAALQVPGTPTETVQAPMATGLEQRLATPVPVQVSVVHWFASPQFVAAFAAVHVNVQSARQPSLLFAFAPSSHCSVPLTMLSPHAAATHAPATQMFAPPHVVPSVGTLPAPHALVTVPAPAQTSAPLQALPSVQSTSAEHVNVQSLSQPSPLTVLPSSHCSPVLVKPSPHATATHAPALQSRPEPHSKPSAGGVPGAQRLAVEPPAVHVSRPLQRSVSAQSPSSVHVNAQAAVQPSVSSVLPSSQASPASVRPLPQRSS